MASVAMLLVALSHAADARAQELQLGEPVDPWETSPELTGPIVSLIGAVHLVAGG